MSLRIVMAVALVAAWLPLGAQAQQPSATQTPPTATPASLPPVVLDSYSNNVGIAQQAAHAGGLQLAQIEAANRGELQEIVILGMPGKMTCSDFTKTIEFAHNSLVYFHLGISVRILSTMKNSWALATAKPARTLVIHRLSAETSIC